MGLIKSFQDTYSKNNICPNYKKHAKEDYLFSNKQTFCNIQECPYHNQVEPEFMVEKLPKICTTSGLTKKLKK
jgi:hypothetical protein